MIILVALTTVQHEKVHKQIAIYHGGFNCTIYYNLYGILGGEMMCNKYKNVSSEWRKQEVLLHSWNEIITYNIQIIWLMIYILYVLNGLFKRGVEN